MSTNSSDPEIATASTEQPVTVQPKAFKEFEINQQLLELILEQEVASFTVKLGSAPGDNYMSIMHAVEVHIRGAPNPRHIVIKCYPNQAGRRDFLDQVDVFGTEFFFYSEWAPKLLALADAGRNPALNLSLPEFLGGNRTFGEDNNALAKGQNRSGPFTYPEPWTHENFIVMSDLRRERGLQMADRLSGVDTEHAILVVKQLGTLHALSWVLKLNQGLESAKLHSVYPDMKNKTYGSESFDAFGPLLVSINQAALAQAKKYFGPDNPIYLGLDKFYQENETISTLKRFLTHEGTVERELEALLRVRDERKTNFLDEPWLVTVHGDCWINNLMFNYNKNNGGNNPSQVVMLDFQLSHEACPTTDLAYFIYSSTTRATRKESETRILREYYDQFILTCDTLDSKPLPGFSWATLQRRYRRAKVYGFVMALVLLNVMLKPKEEAVEMDDLDGSITDVFSTIMLKTEGEDENEILKTRTMDLVQELYDQGIF